MSWLSSLHQHAIFALPLNSSSSTTSSLPLPTSPSRTSLAHNTPSSATLPQIFPSSSSSSIKPSPFQPTTPSRTPSKSSSNIKKHEYMKQVERLEQGQAKRKSRMCLIGGDLLIIAVGKELRVCSLKRVKSGYLKSQAKEQEYDLGDYKVLNTGITFDIQEVVLNQTSKLLACIGIHSISVISLPTSASFLSSPTPSLDVRCLEIGNFYHSLPGSPSISSAFFHPLGLHSTSLLILTEDSTLREYTLHESSQEPSQTISFLREQEVRKKRGYSAEDEGGKIAVGMVLGEDEGKGWGNLTVYVAMRNGEMRSICPFLPKRTSIRRSYLESLNSFTSTKLDLLSSPSPASTSSSSALTLTRSTDHPSSSSSDISQTDKLVKRYSLQLQYLQTLLRQLPPPSTSTSEEEEMEEEMVDITAPISRPSMNARIVGPYLYSPETVDLEHSNKDDYEARVTDVMFIRGREGGGIGRLLMSWNDGKLEVLLTIDGSEAKFVSEEQEEEDGMMFVRETLDLGLSTREGGWTTMKRDPFYDEDGTVWVYSGDGVQCLILGDEEGEEESQVYWVVKTRSSPTEEEEEGSEVVGLEVVGDVYLGYGLMAITESLQVVGVELSLRVDQEELVPEVQQEEEEKEAKEGGYKSLLESPFILPRVFSTTTRPPPPPLGLDKGELKITPDSLRTMGNRVESYQSSIRDLVEGVDQVQHRLELQMKELSRQLSSLSELGQLSNSLQSSTCGDSGLSGRMKRVEQVQVGLLERLDRVLQGLMERHQGRDELSLYEKKWFDELKRVEREQVGLGMKSRRVEAMWEELSRDVERMSERKRREREGTPVKGGLGKEQVRGLEEKLSIEAKLLAEAKKKVERLTHSLSQTTI